MSMHTSHPLDNILFDWANLIDDAAYWRIDCDSRFRTIVKFEGFNPAGSIKLKPALKMLEGLESSGILKPGVKVIESSSGNLGVALAMVCARLGYEFTCVVDLNTAQDSIKIMNALGVKIIVIKERDQNGGYLSNRIRYIKEQIRRDPSFVWTNQYANKDNPNAHEQLTAKSIHNHHPDLNYLFVGAGTTGTLMGCGAYFKKRNLQVKVIGVDVIGSVTFQPKAAKRKIPGLGTSCRPDICDNTLIDDVIWVSEKESIDQCQWFAQNYGLLLGGSSGSVLAGIRQYASKIQTNAKVVFISPDRGDKYLDTVYNPQWVAENYPEFSEMAASC